MRDLPSMEYLMDEFSPADPVDERYAELYERRLRNAWAKTLDDPDGRFLVWSLLDRCHVFSSTYTGNAASNFLEGERNIGLQILREHVFPQGHQTLGVLMEEADHRHSELMAAAEAQVHGERDDRAD